jgi:hypothetical protein
MELATFCELFAQLRETTAAQCASTREFVDRVRLLVHRLNAIAPGSIGDRAHIAILLTQIGPEYVLVVDVIQNDKDPVNPTTIGNRLANAEQTVQRKSAATIPHGTPGSSQYSSNNTSINTVQKTAKKCNYCKKRGHVAAECRKKRREQQPPRDHALKMERSASGSPRHNVQSIPSSKVEERRGPPTSKRPRINIVSAGVTALYTHAPQPLWILDSAATSHICWDQRSMDHNYSRLAGVQLEKATLSHSARARRGHRGSSNRCEKRWSQCRGEFLRSRTREHHS